MVESLYFVPQWFFYIDILLGVLFTIVTALVAGYAIRLYNLSGEREFGLFGISFACLSISYLMRIGLNSFLTAVFEKAHGILWLRDINIISKGIIYIYVMFYVIGYLTLFYTTLKINGPRVYAVMLVMSMVAIAFSMNKSGTVYLISSIFLAGIVWYYARVVVESKWKEGRAMLAATLLLLISAFEFMIIADYKFYQGYIISNVLELAAYSLIGYRLARIVTHGQKKK